MKNKFSGFIASGQTHSKISLGDIFKDSYGYRVKIISVDDRRVSYLRDGYDFECVKPRQQFERDFILVKNCKTDNQRRAAGYIRKIRAMLVAGGNK